jgi:hypothetical protein
MAAMRSRAAPPGPIVCWDFDETLGYFRPLEFAFLGEPVPPAMPAPRLKPGIRELLAELDDFTHVLTTAAIGAYAFGVLAERGLLPHFAAVFGREDGMLAGDGKNYAVVGERFGIAPADLRRRLLIVGNDAKRDADYLCRQVVVVYDAEMADQPSAPLGAAIRRIAVAGGGDIKGGFDRLIEGARRAGASEARLLLAHDMECGLDYWGSYAEDKLHPMVIRPRLRAP